MEAIKGNFICETQTMEGTETQREKHQKLELKLNPPRRGMRQTSTEGSRVVKAENPKQEMKVK